MSACFDLNEPLRPPIPPKPLYINVSPTVSDAQQYTVSYTAATSPSHRASLSPALPIPIANKSLSQADQNYDYVENTRNVGAISLPTEPPSSTLLVTEPPTEPATSQASRTKPTITTLHRTPIYEDLELYSAQELSEVIAECNNSNDLLPMRVRFCESMYGFCESFTFLAGDLLDVHFLKETLCADVRTVTGRKLKVPLQAPFRFVLDYSPDTLTDRDCKVSQLLKHSNLPKLAIVKEASPIDCSGSSSRRHSLSFSRNKSSHFVKDEVLVLLGRIKSKKIECISLSDSKEKKKLHKSSEIVLTVNPSQLMIDFMDLKYFELPLQAHILVTPAKLQSSFPKLSTISSLTKEKSLIASFRGSKACEEGDIEQQADAVKLHEIFADTPISVQKVDLLQSKREILIRKSKLIHDNFTPNKISEVLSLNTNNDHRLQNKLYKATLTHEGNGNDRERWKCTVELKQPDAFHNISSIPQLPHPSSKRFPEPPQSRSLVVDQHSIAKPIMPSHANSTAVPEIVSPNICYLSSLPFRSTVGSTGMPLLHPCVLQFPSHSNSREDPYSSNSMSSIGSFRKNLQLEDLSCGQVLHLLDKLGLSQYREQFAKEQITGGLLRDLDEDILEQELGISLRLHRIKLLRVIEGKEMLDQFFK